MINLKNKLKEIYGKEYYDGVISKLSKKEIYDLVENISNGIPIGTPVFDGASTKDITEMLRFSKTSIKWTNKSCGMEEQVKDLIDRLLSEQFTC